jgi:chemotaxis protein CheZ
MASHSQAVTVTTAGDDYSELAREVDMIALYIHDLRAAINGLGVLDITDKKLSAVQADINVVIVQTRTATDTVLETAENLLASDVTGSAYHDLVNDQMIRLMEACTFQDITGQRLSRVAETLNAMEERLKRFAGIVKPRHADEVAGPDEARRQAWRQRNLVHGPGGAEVVDQSMIDRLMDSVA